MTGHPGVITRVLASLPDNAERHAATTITVTLTTDHDHRQAALDVANDGSPIPPGHRETITRAARHGKTQAQAGETATALR
ncbi:ATP-binding protein [Streptomyces misionensis]|uniref:ATP-binding protein n=1 Tax=Streptomyces misionensis TaxID=67331 RepID=UPI00368BB671